MKPVDPSAAWPRASVLPALPDHAGMLLKKENAMPSTSKLLAVFAIVFAAINLMLLSVIYLTGRFSMSPGSIVPTMIFWFIATIVLGLVFQKTLKSYGVVAVMMLGLIASFVGAVLFMDTFALMTKENARDVTVADARKHADAAVIFFRDGTVVKDCLGEIEESDEDSRVTYFAAPYVSGAWDRTRPVTVWVTCRHDKANCLNSTGIGLVAKRYTAGIDEAVKKCGLKSDPNALRIEWIGPPENEIREGKKYLGMIAGGINALWVIVFLGMVINLKRKNN
jgi:hypothetical protein